MAVYVQRRWAVSPSGVGNLIAYAFNGAEPLSSTLNYQNGTFALAWISTPHS